MHLVFTILICIINKTERKGNSFSSSQRLLKASVLSVFPLKNYKSSIKEVFGWKKFNREIESVRNITCYMMEKKSLAVCRCARTQGQKNTLSLKFKMNGS